MAARREKGLCYNCDAHYSPNHKCQTKFFLLIASDDVSPDDPIPPDLVPILSEDYTATPSDDHFLAQLSLHAMADHLASTMFRVNGCINGTEVIILVDGGSTHNFIHDRLARSLHLKAQPVKRLCVMVGNGGELCCDRVCKAILVNIQGYTFMVDLFVMALEV